jgi:sulfite reductase alpha subunit-like flavoprotein
MDVWLKESLFPILPKRDEVIVDDPSVTSLYKVEAKDEELKEDEMSWYQDFFASLAPPTAYRIQQQGMYPRVGTVVSNDRLTDPSWEQNTRHLVISVLSAKEKLYHAGDICSVLPRNSDQAVQDFLQVLPAEISNNADRTLGVSIRVEDHSVPWPRQCTLRGWLTYCADICGLPEREDLRALSYYCRSPEQADKLQSLSETSGSALYADYVLREKRSWRDVLYDFDGLNLDLNSLFQLLPSLRARHFSIASPSSLDKVELCVAVVEGTTPLGRSYHGLCSNYLANLKSGNLIRFWLKPGSFQHLPLTIKSLTAQYEAPILCIGAGTGIAPLRSIILEREQHRPLIDLLTDFPECDARLVFGCRKKSMDYYYENDWDHLEAARRFRVWTAFSRDQWHKIYVQQVMGQHKDVIVKHILQDQGAIYIAGGAKMARAVKDELLEILGEAMGDDKTAQLLVKQFQRRGLYAVEAWS